MKKITEKFEKFDVEAQAVDPACKADCTQNEANAHHFPPTTGGGAIVVPCPCTDKTPYKSTKL